MNEPHVLIVEDEEKIAQLLVDYFVREGFATSVLHEGTDAVETVRTGSPDMIILDLMLPGKDGLSICREVRQFSQVPILMLTAKVDEIDRLIGLEIGADDYVCKPFSPREVVARVRAILRRQQGATVQREGPAISYGDIELDSERFECALAGRQVELTPVEFKLLEGFLRHPGRVFSRQALMDIAYSDERVVSDRTIDTHIKNLRRKLATANADTDLIHSIYGMGYKLD